MHTRHLPDRPRRPPYGITLLILAKRHTIPKNTTDAGLPRKVPVHDFQSAESWLRKALRNAPKPLPSGVFPKLLDEAEQAGFSHSTLNDVVDEWLNFGYCRVTDHVSNDIALTPEGDEYFGHRTIDE